MADSISRLSSGCKMNGKRIYCSINYTIKPFLTICIKCQSLSLKSPVFPGVGILCVVLVTVGCPQSSSDLFPTGDIPSSPTVLL